MKVRLIALLASLLLISGLLSLACTPPKTDKISDIKSSPSNFQSGVTVQGTVGTSFWIGPLDKGAYELSDGTGTIWVVTTSTPPDKNTVVRVKGSVESLVNVGGRYLGTVVYEQSRQTLRL